MRLTTACFSAAAVVAVSLANPQAISTASAAQCGNDSSGFSTWLVDFKKEASRYGLKQRTLDSTLKGVTYNPTVIKLDRNQKSFKLSFDEFYARRVNNAMIKKGRAFIQNNKRLIGSLEKRYGVPGEILMSIWGLETGYGRNSGNMSVIRSLATLAYDCRRSAFFTNELVNALMIVQRGDMAPASMKGAWAGEIGQTQFLASSYMKYAVDGDGNGRRDLIRSVPDVLASTANYLKKKGWRRGEGWGEGTANYGVLREWNRAGVYVKTISVMAAKMAG